MSKLDCYFPIGTSILVNLSAKLTLFLEITTLIFPHIFLLNAIFLAKKMHKITF